MQNNDECEIYIWDELVGKLILINEVVYFKYDKSFKREISPIVLPLGSVQYDFNLLDFQYKLAGVFSDSMPDTFGDKIINKYFDENFVDFIPNIIDKLLFIGEVSLGAIKYKPSMSFNKNETNIPIELKEIRLRKKKILTGKKYSSVREAIDMYRSFSPTGGAREKMLLNHNPKTGTFSIGEPKNDETALIVKLDESEKSGDLVDSFVEYVYSLTAKECGIDMPQTYLLSDEDGFTHFATTRFDIDENKQRLHVHTLSGLLNFKKSQRIDYTKFMDIAKLHLYVDHSDIEEIYRRMVFNYVFCNNDEHLKNHSFIMKKNGEWSLSPAYDLMYSNSKAQRVMRLSINQKISNEVTIKDFEEIGVKHKISNYKEIIKQTENSVDFFIEMLKKYLPEDRKFDKLEIIQSVNKFY